MHHVWAINPLQWYFDHVQILKMYNFTMRCRRTGLRASCLTIAHQMANLLSSALAMLVGDAPPLERSAVSDAEDSKMIAACDMDSTDYPA
jgi:hypothetical protein